MKPWNIGLVRYSGKVWWWLRQVSGDAAYENYLKWTSLRPSTRPESDTNAQAEALLLSPEEFYVETLRRKYLGLSRCC